MGAGSGGPGRGLVVALETSTRRPTVAARSGGRTLERGLDGERAHASDLLPALGVLLEQLGVDRKALVRVVVGVGPGSLTGMRVGVATALGLVQGSGAEIVGVPSFEAAALRALRSTERADARVQVLCDARGGRFDLAEYERAGDGLRALFEPTSLTLEEAAGRTLRFDGTQVLCDASSRERFAWADGVRSAELAPRATDLIALGAARPAQAPADVEPLYLRAWEGRTRKR
ncbi:tRNA threonylcarbamoyladenosine biosynthesis protein TsaB [Planctomycetes bacterium Pla163]|uniref:tRNA threonylcarbamoyladenosine biosynthesis protein TsaB n=1 Tax=Rohdeia mirabilis TaxID=2528008 RepID=A0A518D1Z3_9BACT|nr:tRNA threonylcarbamoyladenosine biosynthesis protein TsaB [Planctomycetes bacterium Pla163]